MLVDVKTEYHTFGCRPSRLLCGVLLNRVQRLSVIRAKNCFNRSRGSRNILAKLSSFNIMHHCLRFGDIYGNSINNSVKVKTDCIRIAARKVTLTHMENFDETK